MTSAPIVTCTSCGQPCAEDAKPGAEDAQHCDAYAERPFGNPAARWFIFIERLPASLRLLARPHIAEPRLFADYQGRRVRVVMASRFGDLGITYDLTADQGYELRAAVGDLENFSAVP